MLRRLSIKDFKSLADVEVRFPALTVLFGPNAAGKSNLLDAVQALSRIGTSRTLSEALSEPTRGYPIEAFAFPPGGLPALLNMKNVLFKLEADLDVGRDSFRYRIEVAIQPDSGALSVADEYLTSLTARAEPKGNPSSEQIENEQKKNQLRIRRKRSRHILGARSSGKTIHFFPIPVSVVLNTVQLKNAGMSWWAGEFIIWTLVSLCARQSHHRLFPISVFSVKI